MSQVETARSRVRRGMSGLLLVLALACTAPPEGPPIQRLLTEDPEMLQVDDLFRRTTVATVEFAHPPGAPLPWKIAGGEVGARQDGLELTVSDGTVWIDVDLAVPASEVQAFELELDGVQVAHLLLYWKTESENWNSNHVINVRAKSLAQGSPRVARFQVDTHPAWHGRTVALRLGVNAPGRQERVVLHRLVAHRYELDPQRLPAMVGRSWKVELAHEVRNAWLLPPGLPLELPPVTVPKDGALRFAYGLQPSLKTPVTFRATAKTADGTPHELFTTDLAPAGEAAASWHEARVDLAALAGQTVAITLDTLAGDVPLELGLPIVAHPEVIAGESPAEPPVNVVLISIDTLRADRLGLYGADQPTSPHLDRWAQERAVRFSHAVAQAPWTLPSHVSLLTGRDAIHHGVNLDGEVVPPAAELLAERFRAAGYATAAVTGGAFLHPRYGFAQGFDRYAYWPQQGDADEVVAGMDRALAWLEDNANLPFFLFFHTYEVHGPYRAREPYYTQFGGPPMPAGEEEALITLFFEPPQAENGFRAGDQRFQWNSGPRNGQDLRPDELAIVRARYDSAIAFTDAQLARLFDLLAARGIADRTLVVITSDHGEGLGENGRGGHGYLYESNLLVPLVVAFPGRRGAGTTVDWQVRSIDVGPTILEAAGLAPLPGIDGRSLLPLLDGGSDPQREAWTYAAAFNLGASLRLGNRVKYTFNNTAWPEVRGREALYRLDRDPDELTPVDDPLRDTLGERVREELATRLPGLRVLLQNHGDTELAGELSLPGLGPVAVKAATATSCRRCVRWQRPHGVKFRLPPGERQEITLAVQLASTLTLTSPPDAAPVTIDLVAHDEPVVATWDGDGWQVAPGAPADLATGLAFRWVGERVENVQNPLAADPELRERLRALGYVQ